MLVDGNRYRPRLSETVKAQRAGQAPDATPAAAIPTRPRPQATAPSFGSHPGPRPPAANHPNPQYRQNQQYQQHRPNGVPSAVPGPSESRVYPEPPAPQVHALRQDRPRDASDLKPLPALSDQACLLESAGTIKRDSEVEKAVMFSAALLEMDPEAPRLIPQYGLLGTASDIYDYGEPQAADRRVFLNTNYPASFFICGLQGSGKSHTTSCILG